MIKISTVMKKIIFISSLILLLLVLVSLSISIGSVNRQLKNRNEALYTAITDINETIELLHRNSVDVSNDLNTLRTAMSLDPVEYPVLHKDELEDAGNSELMNYLLSVDALLEKNSQSSAGEKFNKFITSKKTADILKLNTIKTENRTSFSADLSRKGIYYGSVSIDISSGKYLITYADGDNAPFSDADMFEKMITDGNRIFSDRLTLIEKQRSLFKNAAADTGVKMLLDENKARIVADTSSPYKFDLIDRFKIRQDVFSYDEKRNIFSSASGLSTDSYDKFLSHLKEQISFVESRSHSEVLLENGQKRINELLADPSFSTLMSDKKLKLSSSPRYNEEDDDYVFYDLTDGKGTKIGSFGILKNNGRMYVLDKNDLPISSVESIKDAVLGNTVKKKATADDKLPQINDVYSSKDSFSIVAIGSHEKDADSIILIHGNKKTDSLYMVSIPRDIYYNGQKINNILKVFGPEKFIEELSSITGLEIDKYIQIDMYAFIDAVNIVGGIDITLDSPVIDPTMKTLDDGVWGTLHYAAGTHHLSGKQALRLARSRHYSSDFERSRRQQQILLGLKESIFQHKNISTIYELVNTLVKHLDTNFSPAEIVNLLLTFKNADIKKQEVISTSNVLYPTHSEVYKAEKRGETLKENSYQGLWILVPVNDDWNKIRYYIRKVIGEA